MTQGKSHFFPWLWGGKYFSLGIISREINAFALKKKKRGGYQEGILQKILFTGELLFKGECVSAQIPRGMCFNLST